MSTVIKLSNGQSAIVFDADGNREMYVPNKDDEEELSDGMTMLLMCEIMLEDPRLLGLVQLAAAAKLAAQRKELH